MHSAFQSAFKETPGAPPSPEGNMESLQEWMQTFYRRPRGDLLLGAFAQALVAPGAFVREHSLPAAVFLSVPLRHMLSTQSDVHTFMTAARSTCRMRGSSSDDSVGAEHLDTLLRALYACNAEHMDAFLSDISAEWQRGVVSGRGGEEDQDDLLALAQSILPPPQERQRAHVMAWPIPSLSLSKFEKTLKEVKFPVYGATRFWFMRTLAAHRLAATDAASFAVYVPYLAQEVTCAMVDAYWSHFYATGDTAVVGRVLDVGTPYIDFMEEYGDVYVTQYGDGKAAPLEFEEDPFGGMKFETSRYALWTLLLHAGTHTQVGQAFFDQLSALSDTFVMMDPVSREENITAVGRSRLELMQLLADSMAVLLNSASKQGIGSGEWPARLALPGTPSTPLLSQLAAQHSSAQAQVVASTPILPHAPLSGLKAAGSVSELISAVKARVERSKRNTPIRKR